MAHNLVYSPRSTDLRQPRRWFVSDYDLLNLQPSSCKRYRPVETMQVC